MNLATTPIFVIVPGATQTPSHYASLIHFLQTRGYGTLTALLSSGGATQPVTAEDDAEFIRSRMLLPLLDVEKHDVVLIMHSYAGIPESAATRGLGKVDREASGDGSDILATFGGQWPGFINVKPCEGRITFDEPKIPLYSHVPSPLDKAAEMSCISHNVACFTSPCPPTSWHTEAFRGGRAYVQTLHDTGLPYEIQAEMLRRMERDWIVRDIATGHSLQLAAPAKLTDIILEVTEQFGMFSPKAGEEDS